MFCKEQHRYNSLFEDLSDEQGGNGRHKCAGCAYMQGYNDGFNRKKPNLNEDILPDSQAGTVRHKSVSEAYDLGYETGLNNSYKK